jgi:hypothetical protein
VNARLACGLALLAAAAATACAPARLQLPSGDGDPFPSYAEAAREATAACREVRTLSAELGLSGRAGSQKLRGHATVGLSAPASLRLEGAAPFGPPAFILTADSARATLLLPRDNRTLTAAEPSEILEALVGLDLGATDLLALLSGCVVANPQPTGGRLFPGGWARVDTAGDACLFLRRDGRQRWVVRAGTRPALRAEYERDATGSPTAVRIVTGAGGPGATDLRVGLSQVDLNTALGAEVFQVKLPAAARPMTLDELRLAGPMGDRR